MPENHWILLHCVVFCAALVQAATGFGFGLIAVSVLLIVLNSSAAIQVAIMLSLLIALILVPSLRSFVDRRLLRLFVIGAGVGVPLGVVIFLVIDLILLKVLTGLVVMISVLFITGRVGGRANMLSTPSSRVRDLTVGIMAGIMNASLAIPGPLPVARMVRLGATPETIRATILALFVFSYPVAITLQALMAGVSPATLKVTAALIPATLVGILTGRILASRITERMFIRITVVLLTATSLGLFVNAGYVLVRT